MKDLHKFYPESLPNIRRKELRGLTRDKVFPLIINLAKSSSVNSSITSRSLVLFLTIYMKILKQLLIYFCKALQGLGDTSNMSNERIDDIYENDQCKNVDKLGMHSTKIFEYDKNEKKN